MVQGESREQCRAVGPLHHRLSSCLSVNDTEAPEWVKVTRITSAALEPGTVKELLKEKPSSFQRERRIHIRCHL